MMERKLSVAAEDTVSHLSTTFL